MRTCALAVLLLGCDTPMGCPSTPPGQRSACETPDTMSCSYGTDTQCGCVGGTWFCTVNDCPPGIPGGEPLACASTDTGCSYSDWEHDCTCSCVASDQGRW